MSRSIRGGKGPGFDFWSKRPHSGFTGYGKDARKKTVRTERQQGKTEARQYKPEQQ